MSADKLTKGYTCKCGKFNLFSLWVFAHWDELITHKCECGRTAHIRRGFARKFTKPAPAGGENAK